MWAIALLLPAILPRIVAHFGPARAPLCAFRACRARRAHRPLAGRTSQRAKQDAFSHRYDKIPPFQPPAARTQTV